MTDRVVVKTGGGCTPLSPGSIYTVILISCTTVNSTAYTKYNKRVPGAFSPSK